MLSGANKRKIYMRFADKVIILFWLLYLLVRLWFADSDNMSDGYKSAIIVPYVDFNIGITMLAITLLICICLILSNRFRFDENLALFLIRIPLYFIPLLYIEGTYQWGVAFAVIQTMLAYYIGYNYKGSFKIIVNLLIAASIMLGLQICFTFFVRELSIFEIDKLKFYMRLPMGQTNSLGAFIVVVCVLVDTFYNKNKKLIKYVYFIFMFVCLVATGTRSGIIILVGYYLCKLAYSIFVKQRLTIRDFLLITFICIAIIIFIIYKYDTIISLLQRFTLENMASNRLKVYSDVLEIFSKNPLLGRSAFLYQAYDAVRAHNFILESLVQTGLIGTSIYLYLLYKVCRKIKKIKDKTLRNTLRAFIAITLIHGLVEPNLFSVTSDTFVWFIIGIGVSLSKCQVTSKSVAMSDTNRIKIENNAI